MRQSKRGILVLPAIAAFVVLVDQLSKYLVVVWLEEVISTVTLMWIVMIGASFFMRGQVRVYHT